MRLKAPPAVFVVVAAAAVLAAAALGEEASAGTFTVDSTADAPDLNPGDGVCSTASGACTLRAAIEEANAIPGMDLIEVPAGVYPLTSQLVIEDSVFLTGAGAEATILDGQAATSILRVRTIAAFRGGEPAGDRLARFVCEESDSVFCVDSPEAALGGPTVSISGITIANGKGEVAGFSGGLVVDEGAHVTLTNATVRDNDSNVFGGGIRNEGNLTLRRVEVTGNTLPEGFGGQTSQGGGIFNIGILDLDQCLVHDNFAGKGGGISNTNEGRIDIINSTISGNRTNGAGGGIRNVANGRINITFSTVTQNTCNVPGGGETEHFGGGIFNKNPARISMGNTIVAENEDNLFDGHADYAPDCHSPVQFDVVSERDNLIGIVTDNFDFGDVIFGDDRFIQFGTPDDPLDPGLLPLGNYGGPTRTHKPTSSSPAVDADIAVTSSTFFDCDVRDQRQEPRPIDGDIDGFARCDIGAHELQPPNDGDGVAPGVEDGAPNGGDGNGDGIPDRLQPSVASLPNAVDGQYVTLVASEGSVLSNVVAIADPSGGNLPPNVLFPLGSFGFTVTADPDATVDLIFPAGVPVDAYYKFGPEPGNLADHWYLFAFNGTTGATFLADRVVLRFRDGQRGDDDLAVNGVVVEPGGPAEPDSDGDGLGDFAEVNVYGTDPFDSDTDDDGLGDGDEVLVHLTDPLDPDSDDDGLLDGLEVAAGVDPLDPDTDNDGVPDGLDVDVLRDVILGLAADVFHANGHGKALKARLASVEAKIASGRIDQAIVELVSIRKRVDGCGATPGADDWILDCDAQVLVRALIDSLISNLSGP